MQENRRHYRCKVFTSSVDPYLWCFSPSTVI